MGSRKIDDGDSSIVYSTSSGKSDWEHTGESSDEFMGTTSRTHVQGATAKLTFQGTSIRVLGTIPGNSSSTYSLDGSDPVQIHNDTEGQTQSGQLYFISPDLPNGEHTLEVTNDLDQLFILDFFLVFSPDIPTTNTTASSSDSLVPTTSSLTTTASLPRVVSPAFVPKETPIESTVFLSTPDTTNTSDSTPASTFNTESSTSIATTNPRSPTPTATSNSRSPAVTTTTPPPSLSTSTGGFPTSPNHTSEGQPTASPSRTSEGQLTTSPGSTSDQFQASESSLSKPVVAGIVVGCLIPLFLAIAFVCLWRARRRKRGSSLTPYPFVFASHSKKWGSFGTILDITGQPPTRTRSMECLTGPELVPPLPPISERPPAIGRDSNIIANSVAPIEPLQYVSITQVPPRTSLLSGEDEFSQTETFVDGVTRTLTMSSSGIPRASRRRGRSLNAAERGVERTESPVDITSGTGIAI